MAGKTSNGGGSSGGGRPPSPWPCLVPAGHHVGKPPIPLTRPLFVVGSRSNCHLNLLSSSISKTHALILTYEGRVYIRDLASRTHVLVNARQVLEANLVEGDRIQIGTFEFTLQLPKGSDTRPEPPEAPAAVLEGSDKRPALRVAQRVILIGRRPGCDLPLSGDAVSNCHAVVFAMGPKRYIRDLGSRTGTFVNDLQEKQTELHYGDVIRIGETSLQFSRAPDDPTLAAALDELEDLVGTAPLTPSGTSGLAHSEPKIESYVEPHSEPDLPRPPRAVEPSPAPVPVSKPAAMPVEEFAEIDLNTDPDVSGNGPEEASLEGTAHITSEAPAVKEPPEIALEIPAEEPPPEAAQEEPQEKHPQENHEEHVELTQEALEAALDIDPDEAPLEIDASTAPEAVSPLMQPPVIPPEVLEPEIPAPAAHEEPAAPSDDDLDVELKLDEQEPASEISGHGVQDVSLSPAPALAAENGDQSSRKKSAWNWPDLDDAQAKTGTEPATAVSEPAMEEPAISQIEEAAAATVLELDIPLDEPPAASPAVQEVAQDLDIEFTEEGLEMAEEPTLESAPEPAAEAPAIEEKEDEPPPAIAQAAAQEEADNLSGLVFDEEPEAETTAQAQVNAVLPAEPPEPQTPEQDLATTKMELPETGDAQATSGPLDTIEEPPAPEPPPQVATVYVPPSEAPTLNVMTPEAGAQVMGFSSPPAFFASDQGSFLGGLPLSLQELPPPPPMFGQVQVTFGDQASGLRSAIRQAMDEKDETGKEAPNPYNQLKVGIDEAPPAISPEVDAAAAEAIKKDSSPEAMLRESRRLLPKMQVPPRPIRRTERRGEPVAPPAQDANPFSTGTVPATAIGFGGVAADFGGAAGAAPTIDVFGGMTHDLSDDPFLGTVVRQPAKPEEKKFARTQPTPAKAEPASAVEPRSLTGLAEKSAAAGGEDVLDLSQMPETWTNDSAQEENLDDTAAGAGLEPEEGAGNEAMAVDPFALPTPKNVAVPSAESGSGVAAGLVGAPELAAQTPRIKPAAVRDAARPPVMAQPVRPRKRKIGMYLLIMALLMTGAVAAVYWFMKQHGTVNGTARIQLGQKVNHQNWEQELARQSELLGEEQTRQLAASILKKQGDDPGFVGDIVLFRQMLSDQTAGLRFGEAKPPVDGSIVLNYHGSDAAMDKRRIEALLRAWEERNAQGHTDAINLQETLREQTTTVALLQKGLDDNQAKIDAIKQKISDAAAAGTQPAAALEAKAQKSLADYRKAVLAAYEADAEVKDLQQKLSEGQGPASQPGVAAGTTGSGDAATDAPLQEMQKQLTDLATRINQARAGGAQDDAQSHQSLNNAMSELQEALQKAQGLKGNAGLANYIAAAKSLQEDTWKFTNELLDAQAKRNAEWAGIKTWLDQQIEQHRKEIWAGDPELKRLTDDLEMKRRYYNAAVDTGQQADADKLQREIDDSHQRIDDRKRVIGQDGTYEELSMRFQEEIEKSQKDQDLNMNRMRESLAASQQRFQEAAPMVAKLPQEQQELVNQLSDKMARMQDARSQYDKKMADAQAQRTRTIADLEAQAKTLGQKIDDRRRALVQQGAPRMGDEEARNLRDQIAQKQKAQIAAASQRDRAQATWNDAENQLQIANFRLVEARTAQDGLKNLQNDRENLQASLATNQNTCAATRDRVDREMYLIPGSLNVVLQGGERDQRPLYAGGACLAIFAVFSGLILRAVSRSHEWAAHHGGWDYASGPPSPSGGRENPVIV